MDHGKVRLTWPNFPPNLELIPEPYLNHDIPPNAPITLIFGDNISALRALANKCDRQATLVYVDPPFFTGRQFKHNHHTDDEVIAFDDRWEDFSEYLTYIRSLILYSRALLHPEGCLVIHVDPRASHYVRVLGDMVFGVDCFASEIIWHYRKWTSKTPNLQRKHDVLLRFVRCPTVKPIFNQLYEPLAPSTMRLSGGKKMVSKRAGNVRDKLTISDEDSPGVYMGDVWEMSTIAANANERVGYPTQKPEALLERLITLFTNPGDLVVDPTCGSGTTLAVASRMGRLAIGIDSSEIAIRVARERLANLQITPFETSVWSK